MVNMEMNAGTLGTSNDQLGTVINYLFMIGILNCTITPQPSVGARGAGPLSCVFFILK